LAEVALYAYTLLGPIEIVIKVLHCVPEIIESDTIMNFLADEKVSDNEAIVLPSPGIPSMLTRVQKNALTPYRTDWTGGKAAKKDASLRKVDKDPEELSKNDRIYLELFYNLDGYWKARMRGLQLRRNFHSMYDDFRKKLGIIQEASQSLRNSTTFRELLDVYPPSKATRISCFIRGLTVTGHFDGGELHE
jgi:hypothetical protein